MTEAELPAPERRVFGDHPTIQLDVRKLVMLPQARDGLNPEIDNLKESIDTHGLLNPVDVACMAAADLEEYIDFVNHLWGTKVSLDDYESQDVGGMYYLVIAGHSRTVSIGQLADEDEHGREYIVTAKLHAVESPDEIIALQLDENIHKQPQQERRAIAIVETYMYGLMHGTWTNESEFIASSGGKFSRRVLGEALGFARLPPEARDFVFAKKISYNAGVALGAASTIIADYTAVAMGFEVQDSYDACKGHHESYRNKIGLMIAHISNAKMNGPAAKKYIQSEVDTMRCRIDELSGGVRDEDDTLFEIDMVDQAAEYRRELEKEYAAMRREIAANPYTKAGQLLDLHAALRGKDDPEAYHQLQIALKNAQQRAGERTLGLMAG